MEANFKYVKELLYLLSQRVLLCDYLQPYIKSPAFPQGIDLTHCVSSLVYKMHPEQCTLSSVTPQVICCYSLFPPDDYNTNLLHKYVPDRSIWTFRSAHMNLFTDILRNYWSLKQV